MSTAGGLTTALELILGGARSGKSSLAETRAGAWLAQDPQHTATLIATATAADDEMADRIRRHQADRATRIAAMATLEVQRDLPEALNDHTDPKRLLVVDCLTLWLTQCLMPFTGSGMDVTEWRARQSFLLQSLQARRGPVVLVSNEIGLGVLPMGRETRAFVDALGMLHQQIAHLCTRVTLMVAGCEVTVKDERWIRPA